MRLLEQFKALPIEVKEFVNTQHRDAYRLLDACRSLETGLYADGYSAVGANPERRSSIAATGVGLIGLAIADLEGWDPGALPKVKTTLRGVLGDLPGCRPARDPASGFFAHFIDLYTGENMDSEFSTIDTALLVAGALLAGTHFADRDQETEALARRLFTGIDWEKIFVPNGSGAIYMVVENGRGAKPVLPFSEYALVAYLAKTARPRSRRLQDLWHEFWAPNRLPLLPVKEFRQLPVLTDGEGFLSSFVHQFPFYLVPEYSDSPVYRMFFQNACTADRLKWKELGDVPSYVWGYGAGSDEGLLGGYRVDRIRLDDFSGDQREVASAYIVSGFLPIYPGGIYDLYALYKLHLPYDTADNPKIRSAYRFGLHRYSWRHLGGGQEAYPTRVTLVDWSSMLYGLTAFKYGMSFFIDRLP